MSVARPQEDLAKIFFIRALNGMSKIITWKLVSYSYITEITLLLEWLILLLVHVKLEAEGDR